MAKVKFQKISKLNDFVKRWLIAQGSKKDFNSSLSFGQAASIFCLPAYFSQFMILLEDGFPGPLHIIWASKLEKLVTCPARKSTCLGYGTFLKERFHLYVHTTEFSADFKTESIRKLSNFNFQWTKTLYQKINVKFHKMISYTWNFLNFTCVCTILVKFDIYFLGLPQEIVFGVIADN